MQKSIAVLRERGSGKPVDSSSVGPAFLDYGSLAVRSSAF
jgi:hypothetical protein